MSLLSSLTTDPNIQPSIDDLRAYRDEVAKFISTTLSPSQQKTKEVSDRVGYVMGWAMIIDSIEFSSSKSPYALLKRYMKVYKKEIKPPVVSVKELPLKTQYTGLSLRGEWLAKELYTARAIWRLLKGTCSGHGTFYDLMKQILDVVGTDSKLKKAFKSAHYQNKDGSINDEVDMQDLPDWAMNQIADVLVIGSDPSKMKIRTSAVADIKSNLDILIERYLVSIRNLYKGAPNIKDFYDFLRNVFYDHVLRYPKFHDSNGCVLFDWFRANLTYQNDYDLMIKQFSESGLPINHSKHPCEVFTCLPDIRHLLPLWEQIEADIDITSRCRPTIDELKVVPPQTDTTQTEIIEASTAPVVVNVPIISQPPAVSIVSTPVTAPTVIEEETCYESEPTPSEKLATILNEAITALRVLPAKTPSAQQPLITIEINEDVPASVPIRIEIDDDDQPLVVSSVKPIRTSEPVVLTEPTQAVIDKLKPVVEPTVNCELVMAGVVPTEASTALPRLGTEENPYELYCPDMRTQPMMINEKKAELRAEGIEYPCVVAVHRDPRIKDQKVFFSKPGEIPWILDLVEGTFTVLNGYRVIPINKDMPDPLEYAEIFSKTIWEDVIREGVNPEQAMADPNFDPNPMPPDFPDFSAYYGNDDDDLAMEDDEEGEC